MSEFYYVHNTTRDQATRHIRAGSGQTQRTTVILGAGLVRVPRGRPRAVSKDLIVRLRAEILKLEKQGAIKVTRRDGAPIDVHTFAVTAEPMVTAQPVKVLDSVENDKTYEGGVGEPKPNLPGGVPAQTEVAVPAVIPVEEEDEVPTAPDAPAALPPVAVEESEDAGDDLEAITAQVAAAHSAKELAAMATNRGLDPAGSKKVLAQRLVEDGYRLGAD